MESDKSKKDFLFKLAKACLQRLNIQFTNAFLEDAISKAYGLTFESEYKDEFDRNKITVADKEDAGNLAIVLLQALNKYHIKNEVGDIADLQKEDTVLLVLTCPDRNCNLHSLLEVRKINADERPLSKLIDTCVVLKTGEYSGEPGYFINKNKERLRQAFTFTLAIVLAITFGMSVYKGFINYGLLWWMPPLSLTSLGCFVCYQLYKLEKTDAYGNAFLKKICTSRNNNYNCKDVISSPGSRLFGVIRHTDIGIVYFSGMLALIVTALLSSRFEHYLGLLFWMAILPLPYTLFSVYYQLRVIKKRCVLCLTIQMILWLQFACMMMWTPQVSRDQVYPETAIQAILLMSGCILLYFLFTENEKIKKQANALALENFKFKNTDLFFEEAMATQVTFIRNDFPSTFSLGDPSAKEKVSVILSLFCAPCGEKFKDLLKLADWFEDRIDIQIIIKPEVNAASLIKTLMQHIDKGDYNKSIHLLNHWYAFFQKEKEQGNDSPAAVIRKWNAYYPPSAVTKEIEAQYAFQRHFYENYQIPFTPLMQYNGKLLPGMYHDPELLISRIEQHLERAQNYEYA